MEKKRDRNIYLSNLVLCMQEGQLSDVFKQSPNDVHISNALDVFAPIPALIEVRTTFFSVYLDSSPVKSDSILRKAKSKLK